MVDVASNRRGALRCIALALTLASCTEQASEHVVNVAVRDSDLKVVSVLSSSEQLARFEQIWSHKEALQTPVIASTTGYALDIRLPSRTHRWLYDPKSGIASIVAVKASTPSYRILEPDALNSVLGIGRQ